MSKHLLFLTGVGGWSAKGQKHPCVIQRWPLIKSYTENLIYFTQENINKPLSKVEYFKKIVEIFCTVLMAQSAKKT